MHSVILTVVHSTISFILYLLFSRVTRTLTIILIKTFKNDHFIGYADMSGVVICGSLFDLPVSTELLNQNLLTKPFNGLLNQNLATEFSTEPRTRPTPGSFHRTAGILLCRARLLLCIPFGFALLLSLPITPTLTPRLLHLSARPTPRFLYTLSLRSPHCTIVALLLTISLLSLLFLTTFLLNLNLNPYSTFYSFALFFLSSTLPLHTLLTHIHSRCFIFII